MNAKYYFSIFFVLLFVFSAYGLCMAQDQTAKLAVKEIVFKLDKGGKEKVTVICTQACVPVLSGLEGKKARVIMDFTDVSFMEPKYRNIPVSGKFIKKIRSYLDKDSKKLRVVLDMAPSKYFIVRAMQDQTDNAFSVSIAEKRHAKGKDASIKGSRISIIDHIPKPVDKAPLPEKAAVKQQLLSDTRVAVQEKPKIVVEKNLTDKGRSQMNAGNYKGAINTLTQSIADNPKDSLSYRLRGNAYQNIGDRQKAIEDWTTAARLGDQVIQSYLDHMQINWKEASNK